MSGKQNSPVAGFVKFRSLHPEEIVGVRTQYILWGGHLNVKKGYRTCPKIHEKRVFFHNRALNVRNVNRVPNSCKIGLKGYDFVEDQITYLGLFFMQNLCNYKGMIFGNLL